ncbi:MAG: outer membrane lipoprotein carrier protein LolA, partial [Deltaproteobacteria bacterium]|nr:outer membrane lipoprotein carrier protein LolA [Deltaproteobacteria bacterium]
MLSSLVFSLSALAADPVPLVARVEAHYGSVSTLKAAFVQTVRSPTYGDDVQAGTLAVARPGRMRWDFTGDGRVYLVAENRVSIWTPAEKQLLRYPYTPTGADSLLQSLDHVDELFTVTAPDQPSDGGVILDLASKDTSLAGTRVRLVLAPDLSLRQVQLTDPMGTKT